MPSSLVGYINCIDDVADERDTVVSPPFHLSPLEIHMLDIGTQRYMCYSVKVC